MIAIIACAIIVCVAASAIGQAVLKLCGARSWNWMSPAIGLSVMMVVAVSMPHVPGGATTVAVVLGLCSVLAIGFVATSREQWPPLLQVLAGIPVLLLALIPFASSGRAGILGVGLNNDMANHLLFAQSLQYADVGGMGAIAGWFPSGYTDWYPIGPHAVVAALGQGTGAALALAFSGLSVALPVLLGWTALGALRSSRVWGPFIVAPLAGLPFLVAAYFGQGAFKELLLAILALSIAVHLGSQPHLHRMTRWIPVALVIGGSLSAYAYPGLAWPMLFLVAWALVRLIAIATRVRSGRSVLHAVRPQLLPFAIGAATVALVMIPQIARQEHFREWAASAGIAVNTLGNLAGPIPFREGLGAWDNGDFRFAGTHQSLVATAAVIVAALVILGAAWALWRREWMLPLAAACSLGIWMWSDRTQSPYVAAKALVILVPMLVLLAVRPLVEKDIPGRQTPNAWHRLSPAVAAALTMILMYSSWNALASSPVGPLDLTNEIATTHSVTGNAPTLFLGNDDFTFVMFGATPVTSPVVGFPVLPMRTDNPWKYGEAYDIDSMDAAVLNRFRFIVAPRDVASSEMPRELRVVRRTPSLNIYERVGRISQRAVLAEHGMAGAILNCNTPQGRRLLGQGGTAAIRPPTVRAPGPTALPPGSTGNATLHLAPGMWGLVVSYLAPRAVTVAGGGLTATLPPNLSRLGPRWPLGRVSVTTSRPTVVRFTPQSNWLTPGTATASIPEITAVREGGDIIVPISAACGQNVDWFSQPTRSSAAP